VDPSIICGTLLIETAITYKYREAISIGVVAYVRHWRTNTTFKRRAVEVQCGNIILGHSNSLTKKLFTLELSGKVKGKEKGHEGLWGCETSRFPHFLDNRLTDGGEVSLTRRQPYIPRKFPGTHFCQRLS
jgi:hypothetical protein